MTDPGDLLAAGVDQIPGESGWWHPKNGETYQRLAVRLRGFGISGDETLNILQDAYWAAADEFGG